MSEITSCITMLRISVSLLLFAAFHGGQACSGTGDYAVINNPVITMMISPPVGWTYFPPKTSDPAITPVYYFIGQSNDTTTAKNRADNEITAAMIEALIANNMPVQGVTVTDDYSPFQVENAGITAMGAGPLYGKVEGGAVTQTAVGGGTTLTYTPFSKQVKVSLYNASNTKYQWNIIASSFQQKLNLLFNARFTGTITITAM